MESSNTCQESILLIGLKNSLVLKLSQAQVSHLGGYNKKLLYHSNKKLKRVKLNQRKQSHSSETLKNQPSPRLHTSESYLRSPEADMKIKLSKYVWHTSTKPSERRLPSWRARQNSSHSWEMGKFTPSRGCNDIAPTALQHILNQFATSTSSLPCGEWMDVLELMHSLQNTREYADSGNSRETAEIIGDTFTYSYPNI